MIVNVWTYYKDCCPLRHTKTYTSIPDSKLNKNITTRSERVYRNIVDFTFLKLIDNVDIRYKIIGEDAVDKTETNWVVVILDNTGDSHIKISMILQSLELIEFVKQNNFKIIIANPLEFINVSHREEFKPACLKLFNLLPPENLQMVFNSYDYTNSHHKKPFDSYITHLDVFPYFMKIRPEKQEIFYPHKDFTYKMCIPVGTTFNRPGRLDFIAELIERDLFFNNDILCTVNVVDEEKERKEFSKDILFKKNYDIINKNKDRVFRRKLFFDSGKEVTGEITKTIWYQTPPQFLDSAVQLIIESRFATASITEKTYRPLAAGQPFIWMAKEKLKPYLESLGYKFYPWIDYSFDNIQYDDERMAALCREAKRIYNLPNLHDLVSENEDITIHNINNFKEHVSEHKEIYKLM